jgi:transcriptional regulator with XRE-family HTH domain
MTQTELGKAVGITFQQVQKYENGKNRISAGHLFAFAQVLECTPNDFFDGLGETQANDEMALLTRDQIQLVKAYARLDEDAREAVLDFARSLASRV